MTTNTNVTEEINQEEVVQTQETTNTSQSSPEAQQPTTENISSKEYNFRRLEESKKQSDKRIEELEGIVRKMSSENTGSETQSNSEDYLGLGDEDLAEGRHLKMVTQELQALKKQMQMQELKVLPDRLTSKFSDFTEVVSKENIEKLKNAEPELYASIVSGTDLYANGVSAYKALKGLGIVNDEFKEQKEQVQENHNRPMSAQSIKGHGALSEKNIFAGGLTPALKKQLQQEMVDAAKAGN